MKRFILILLAMLIHGGVAAPAHAQPNKGELKARFKAREADLRDLKQKGRVGETLDGYVEAVDAKAPADEKTATLLADENKDRRLLYQILADEINKEHPDAKVKATVETIGARNALRNIEHAEKDEFIRVAKDHWIRVKDYPRFEKLNKLKAQGKVGETAAGTVEVVQAADRGEKTLASVVEEENAGRTAEYKALAEKEHVEVSVIVKRMAKRNFENARIGDMLKGEDGTWRKK
jgi:uncharacterized protein YdbL (DUF1318 family)